MNFALLDKFLREHMNTIESWAYPYRINKEPYGTQWHVVRPNEPVICYVQINKDDLKPKWIRLGYLLEKMMFDKANDLAFMEECIMKYRKEEYEI